MVAAHEAGFNSISIEVAKSFYDAQTAITNRIDHYTVEVSNERVEPDEEDIEEEDGEGEEEEESRPEAEESAASAGMLLPGDMAAADQLRRVSAFGFLFRSSITFHFSLTLLSPFLSV